MIQNDDFLPPSAEIYRRLVEDFARRVLPLLKSDAEARIRRALRDRVTAQTSVGRASAPLPTRHGGARLGADLERVIEQTKRLIEVKYASRELTLDRLARRARLSKFYLAHTFQAKVGRAIHQYIVDIRTARARDLLELGHRPNRVWQTAGFADQPHMTRAFRQRLGATPKSFHIRQPRSRVLYSRR